MPVPFARRPAGFFFLLLPTASPPPPPPITTATARSRSRSRPKFKHRPKENRPEARQAKGNEARQDLERAPEEADAHALHRGGGAAERDVHDDVAHDAGCDGHGADEEDEAQAELLAALQAEAADGQQREDEDGEVRGDVEERPDRQRHHAVDAARPGELVERHAPVAVHGRAPRKVDGDHDDVRADAVRCRRVQQPHDPRLLHPRKEPPVQREEGALQEPQLCDVEEPEKKKAL